MKKIALFVFIIAAFNLFAGVQPVTQNPYTTNAPATLAQRFATTVTNNQIFSYFTLTATGEADFRVNSSGNFSIDDSAYNRFQVQDGGAVVLVDESGNAQVVITTNGSTFAGTFTGNGSGLTNMPAWVVTNQTEYPKYSGGLVSWWNADQTFNSSTNEQPFTVWPSYFGGKVLTNAGSPTVSSVGMLGRYSVHLHGGSDALIWSNCFNNLKTLNTNFTLVIVGRDVAETTFHYLWSANTNDAGHPWPIVYQAGNAAASYTMGGVPNSRYWFHQNGSKPFVYIFSLSDQTNAICPMDGKVSEDDSIFPSYATYFFTNSLNIGSSFYGGLGAANFNGYISDILVYTNRMTRGQLSGLGNYFTRIISRRAGNITLGGDSTVSATVYGINPNYTPLQLLNNAVGNAYNIDMVAHAGWTEPMQMTNFSMNWQPSLHPEGGPGVFVDGLCFQNDRAKGITVVQCETNMMNFSALVRGAGLGYVKGLIYSNTNTEPTGDAAALNAWILANPAVFDGYVRYDLTPIGAPGACNNTNYFVDGAHPTQNGYIAGEPALDSAVQQYFQAASGSTNHYGTFTGNGSGLSNPATNTYNMASTGYTNSNPWDVRIFELQGTSILFTNLTSRFGFSIGTISVNNDFVILHTNECVTGTGMTGQILR